MEISKFILEIDFYMNKMKKTVHRHWRIEYIQ